MFRGTVLFFFWESWTLEHIVSLWACQNLYRFGSSSLRLFAISFREEILLQEIYDLTISDV